MTPSEPWSGDLLARPRSQAERARTTAVTGKARDPGGDGVTAGPPPRLELPGPPQLGAHLQPELMARLLTGRLESGELAEVVLAHLLALCPQCRTVRRQLEDCLHEVGHWDYVVALGEGA